MQLGLAGLVAGAPAASGVARADSPHTLAGSFWQGDLGGGEQVSLTIFPRAGTDIVDGTVRYDSMLSAIPRQLDGQLTSGGALSLREQAAFPPSLDSAEASDGARFEGTLSADRHTANGLWTSPDGSARQLVLTRKAVYRENKAEVAGARLAERYPETGRQDIDALIASLRTSGCGEGELECRSAVELVRLDADAVSLLRTTWRYSGGAHGSLDYAGATWRNDAGRDGRPAYAPIRLADLLGGKGCVRKLNAELQASLTQQGAAHPERGALDDQALRDDRTPYTLYRGGLVLHYAPYAVGPFAQGAYQVAVPFARLGGCARPPGTSREESPQPEPKETQT
ncbi:RsiV family protein [Cupriavidus sp. 2TAF22]|uniref:RsiV family protein n=1 Tax=unclassified Cupriavidus TaxID=2640874 RepID=UPI003F93D2E4